MPKRRTGSRTQEPGSGKREAAIRRQEAGTGTGSGPRLVPSQINRLPLPAYRARTRFPLPASRVLSPDSCFQFSA